MNKDEADHKFLLCLDGAGELISHCQTEFNDFLIRLLNECKMLTIIITSSRNVSKLVCGDGFAPKIQLLKPLKMEESAELFLQKANQKQITPEEVYKLILEDPYYPVSKLIDQGNSTE